MSDSLSESPKDNKPAKRLPKRHPKYKVTPLVDADGEELSWVKQIGHPVINGRVAYKGFQFPRKIQRVNSYLNPSAESLNIKNAKACISAIRAQAQLMGEYILDSEHIPKGEKIPVLWIPDGGIITAEGVGNAFVNDGYQCQDFVATCIPALNYFDDKEYLIPEVVKEMAKKTGHLIICDDAMMAGTTLAGVLKKIIGDPSISNCRVAFVVNNDLLTTDIDDEHEVSKNELTALIKGMPAERQKNITLLVANRGWTSQIDSIDVSDAVQYLKDTPDLGQKRRGVKKSQPNAKYDRER